MIRKEPGFESRLIPAANETGGKDAFAMDKPSGFWDSKE